MRGIAELTRPTAEWALLGILLGSASFALLFNELGDGRFTAGYGLLSWLFLGSVVAYWGHLYLKRPGRVDLWTVSLVFAAVFFCAGGIVGLDPVFASTARVGHSLQVFLLLALGLIASRAGFLLMCPAGGAGALKSQLCVRVQATRLTVVFLATASIWGLRWYGASQGLVVADVGDVMTEVGAGASTLIQLGQLGHLLILFLGVVLLMDPRPLRRCVGLLLFAGELGYAPLWSRRSLFVVIVALLLVGLWTGRRLRLRQIVAYSAVAAFLLFVMWPFIFHLRAVAQNSGLYRAGIAARTDILIRDVIPDALATFDLRASFGADSPYLYNVRERSNIADLLVDVMAAHDRGVPFMGGRVFLAALVATIPRAIWPGKERLMATQSWQVEELIEEHFGLPIVDMASTVLTHGYVDGGLLGVLIYMAFLGGFLGVCERSLGASRSSFLGVYVYALGLATAIQVEGDVTNLFAFGRLIGVLLLVDWLAGRRIERLVTAARRRAPLGRPAWEA
jgi:hypothetical protein